MRRRCRGYKLTLFVVISARQHECRTRLGHFLHDKCDGDGQVRFLDSLLQICETLCQRSMLGMMGEPEIVQTFLIFHSTFGGRFEQESKNLRRHQKVRSDIRHAQT